MPCGVPFLFSPADPLAASSTVTGCSGSVVSFVLSKQIHTDAARTASSAPRARSRQPDAPSSAIRRRPWWGSQAGDSRGQYRHRPGHHEGDQAGERTGCCRGRPLAVGQCDGRRGETAERAWHAGQRAQRAGDALAARVRHDRGVDRAHRDGTGTEHGDVLGYRVHPPDNHCTPDQTNHQQADAAHRTCSAPRQGHLPASFAYCSPTDRCDL